VTLRENMLWNVPGPRDASKETIAGVPERSGR
jgi:hypothetical protein